MTLYFSSLSPTAGGPPRLRRRPTAGERAGQVSGVHPHRPHPTAPRTSGRVGLEAVEPLALADVFDAGGTHRPRRAHRARRDGVRLISANGRRARRMVRGGFGSGRALLPQAAARRTGRPAIGRRRSCRGPRDGTERRVRGSRPAARAGPSPGPGKGVLRQRRPGWRPSRGLAFGACTGFVAAPGER